MAKRYYIIPEDLARKIALLFEWASGVKSSGALTDRSESNTNPYRDLLEPGMFIKITGFSSNGTNKWEYDSWTEVVPDGSGGWTEPANARTAGNTGISAYNSVEGFNDGSGDQGNSVDIDGTIFTDNPDIGIVAVHGNPVVYARWCTDSSGDPALIFSYVNAVDGDCA